MNKGYMIFMCIVVGFAMIVSPFMLMLQWMGAIGPTDTGGTLAFTLATLMDVGLLIWWSQRWSRRARIAVLAACICAAVLILTPMNMKRSQLDSVYEAALNHIEAGDYSAALDNLQPFAEPENEKHLSLFHLCRSHLRYEEGEIKGAQRDIATYNSHMPERDLLPGETEYIAQVKAAYDAYLEEEKKAQERAYELSIIRGVPFVGMPERRIDDTSLGKHSGEIRHNNEMVNGDVLKANLYDFVRNGRRIFTARCVDGTVTQVWDWRDQPAASYTPPKTKKSSTEADDPYNAADYHDPEDFYYDYYDDFFEYEEAEEYYYDHAG